MLNDDLFVLEDFIDPWQDMSAHDVTINENLRSV